MDVLYFENKDLLSGYINKILNINNKNRNIDILLMSETLLSSVYLCYTTNSK